MAKNKGKEKPPLLQSSKHDPYAWIVLRLPRKYWTKGQMLLEALKNTFRWSIMTGQIQFDDVKKSNKGLEKSNIVQIVHHALDPSTPEPDGYETVFPFLLKGSTLPKNVSRKSTEKRKHVSASVKSLSKGVDLVTEPFVKDKFLWQVL